MVLCGKSGRVMSTDHYLIRSNIRYERVMDRLPILLEHAIFRYQTAFGTLPEPKSTLDTYVLGDRNHGWQKPDKSCLSRPSLWLPSVGVDLLSTVRAICITSIGPVETGTPSRSRCTKAGTSMCSPRSVKTYPHGWMKASPPTWRGCDSDRPTTIQPSGLGTTGNAGGDFAIPHAQGD